MPFRLILLVAFSCLSCSKDNIPDSTLPKPLPENIQNVGEGEALRKGLIDGTLRHLDGMSDAWGWQHPLGAAIRANIELASEILGNPPLFRNSGPLAISGLFGRNNDGIPWVFVESVSLDREIDRCEFLLSGPGNKSIRILTFEVLTSKNMDHAHSFDARITCHTWDQLWARCKGDGESRTIEYEFDIDKPMPFCCDVDVQIAAYVKDRSNRRSNSVSVVRWDWDTVEADPSDDNQ